jgi:serine/threonine protein phosphatase 1
MDTYAKDNKLQDMIWDRDLVDFAYKKPFKDRKKLTPYKEVFVGHTTTLYYKEEKPIHGYEVWDLDTGAGWGGRLTIMNLDTHEYFQSEFAKKLYPNHHGRR